MLQIIGDISWQNGLLHQVVFWGCLSIMGCIGLFEIAVLRRELRKSRAADDLSG